MKNRKSWCADNNGEACSPVPNGVANKMKLDKILPFVKKPARYIGGELGAVYKDWHDVEVKFCLVFPDLYEIGMSHHGLQLLYHIVNSRADFLAERVFAPDIDMEEILCRHKLPLFSIESRTPLSEFDIIGITLPYELCYTNILTILSMAGLPLRAIDRDDVFPMVIGGGACSFNPEPVADFFDAIVVGDGEEAILEIGEVVVAAKQNSWRKRDLLLALGRIEGVYIPSFFQPIYDDSVFSGVKHLVNGYDRVRRRVLAKMVDKSLLANPLVPIVKPVHDRLGIEVARGCTRGCRFCQAGIIYRPVREREPEEILAIAEEGIANTGFDELALLSLSTGDYSCLFDMLRSLMDRFAGEFVSVSMPSMRVGTLTPQIIEQIQRVRKSGFTVAPEAGTDRLREVINKGIREEDLLATCKDAVEAGWGLIKMYFMVGLPTETMDDVLAIGDLVQKSREAGGSGKRIRVNVSVGTFVPKPHTPFQWQPQISMAEAKERCLSIKDSLPRKGTTLKYHDVQVSFLEGVFSRGDRRLSSLIEQAWRDGCRFDGWSEHFNLGRWQEIATKLGVDLDAYLAGRDLNQPLPWDHIDCGVSRKFLEKEWERALEQVYTEDCRKGACHGCGLCDFKEVKPITASKTEENPQVNCGTIREKTSDRQGGERLKFRYRFSYSRLGDSRFYGHLELLQLVFRVLHRVGLPVLFSQGYNPSPKVSFSQALPVGLESMVEFFEVELAEMISHDNEVIASLNRELPKTIRVTSLEFMGNKKKPPADCRVTYQISFPFELDDKIKKKINDFLAEKSWLVEKFRKGKRKSLDIRPLVIEVKPKERSLDLLLFHPHGKAGTTPFEFLEKVCGLEKEEVLLSRVIKTSFVTL